MTKVALPKIDLLALGGFQLRWFDFGLSVAALTLIFYYALFTLASPIFNIGVWVSIAYVSFVLFFGVKALRRHNNAYIHRRLMIILVAQISIWFMIPSFLVPWGALIVTPWPLDSSGLMPFRFSLPIPIQLGPFPELGVTLPIGIYTLIITLVILPLLSYKFGRRIWCGYLCSFGGFAETVGDSVRCKAPKGKTADLFNWTFLALLVWAVMMSAGFWGWGEFGQLTTYYYNYIVVFFLMAPVFYGAFPFVGGRFWCRFLCPLGGLLGIFSKYGHYAIKTDNGTCTRCGVCTANCQMGIDVQRFAEKGLDLRHEKCVGCGVCISFCPQKVLYFRTWRTTKPREEVVRIVSVDEAPTQIYGYTLKREEAYRLLNEGLPYVFREVTPGGDVYVEVDEEGRTRLEEPRIRKGVSKKTKWAIPPLLCGVMVENVRLYLQGDFSSTAFQIGAISSSSVLSLFLSLMLVAALISFDHTGIDRVDRGLIQR